MTLTELSIVVSIAIAISGAMTGFLMYLDKKKNTELSGMTGKGDYLVKANQSITMALQRAYDAESRAAKFEGEVQELKKQFQAVMDRMQYVITFDVILDPSSPMVEHVEIKHTPNRRKEKRDQ